jgi:prepilin-type N-terminal cleavage/methylation domain-containing protein
MLDKTDGFSLIEVLAAVVIMGFALITLGLSMESSISIRERDRNRTILPILAREKMESIMAGDERAEEGDLPDPWREIHWRLDRSAAADGLTLWKLRLTRRNQRDKTLYLLSTVRLDKERP